MFHIVLICVAKTIACSIVASTFDYCNALLYRAPVTTINKLQRVQNNLARVVCQCRGRADAKPLLHSLHWLPIRQRIEYKIALITYKALMTSNPPYLADLLEIQVTSRAVLLLMHHTSSCLEHGLNLRSELSQSRLPSYGIHCQLLFVTVKLF